jgi:hypothetical protein
MVLIFPYTVDRAYSPGELMWDLATQAVGLGWYDPAPSVLTCRRGFLLVNIPCDSSCQEEMKLISSSPNGGPRLFPWVPSFPGG